MLWQVRVGNVRSVSIVYDDEDGRVSVYVRKQNGTRRTQWVTRSKRLADLTRSPRCSTAAMLAVLYDESGPGRRAWQTRFLNMDVGGQDDGP